MSCYHANISVSGLLQCYSETQRNLETLPRYPSPCSRTTITVKIELTLLHGPSSLVLTLKKGLFTNVILSNQRLCSVYAEKVSLCAKRLIPSMHGTNDCRNGQLHQEDWIVHLQDESQRSLPWQGVLCQFDFSCIMGGPGKPCPYLKRSESARRKREKREIPPFTNKLFLQAHNKMFGRDEVVCYAVMSAKDSLTPCPLARPSDGV
ncbi:uncharacterized protein LOC125459640 [Stegostoma tigrinum]|uniref:uncharacterized protein LOC125459640 n=1 Tax=Stegostoma tigrinum TaxID=3053191 RepID=UPI00202AF031|nr:uncharacterized protein LOC125459640 [Stegostoma tigrinum]